jgi:hypothetical protein
MKVPPVSSGFGLPVGARRRKVRNPALCRRAQAFTVDYDAKWLAAGHAEGQ